MSNGPPHRHGLQSLCPPRAGPLVDVVHRVTVHSTHIGDEDLTGVDEKSNNHSGKECIQKKVLLGAMICNIMFIMMVNMTMIMLNTLMNMIIHNIML